MSSETDRETVVRFFTEVVGGGDLDALDELVTDDYQDHVAFPGQGPGRPGLRQRIALIRAAFGPRQTLHRVLVDEDMVAVHWTLRGVHSGPFLGIGATGRPVEFAGMEMYRMRGGRMAAHWNVIDLLSFYQQVTIAPRHRGDDEREA